MTKNEKAELKMEKQAFNKYMRDPRAFWESIGFALLERPAQAPVSEHTKDGDETTNSQIERLSYQSLKESLKTINDDVEGTREPTELEMMLECQLQHARHSTPAAVFIRDTLGAKPIDRQDIAAQVTDYSQLSDEELEMLAEYREKQKNKEKESCATPEPTAASPLWIDETCENAGNSSENGEEEDENAGD